MEKLYFALVDTPGFFANIIRRVIKQDYIHVVLSMDADLTCAFSIGRRNPEIPIFAGFTHEESDKILRKFPEARYRIISISCTKEQKDKIYRTLIDCYAHRFQYHYCIIGLVFFLLKKPFYQHNHFTCSSFAAKVLEDAGVLSFQKHFSLVTPRDFYELKDAEVEYEGSLKDQIKGASYYNLAGRWV